ncbi:MAG: hypothetical protein WBA51_20015 [Erythrobacter sp.]
MPSFSTQELVSLPKTKEKRIRRLMVIHTRLTDMYGEQYRQADALLARAKAGSMMVATVGDEEISQDELIAQYEDARTQTVLFYKTALERAELLVNELMPGAFPVKDQPPQSVDADEVFQLGASLVAIGTATGQPELVAIGAGLMAGAAIAGMLYD